MRKGFSVVEVMLAAGLFTIFATGMVTATLQGMDNNRSAGEQVIASQYAAEGLEAARSIKNQAFANLVNSTGTGVGTSGGVWTFSGANNTYDKYTRVVTVTNVQRDGSGNIVSGGGTVDTNTKKIISTVSWNVNSARANSVALITYLTNWFSAGKPLPLIPDATLDLDGPGDGLAVAMYRSGATAYAILGRSSASGKEFYVIDVTNPALPIITGSLELGENVNGIAVVGAYAYLATSSNSAELQVISLANPANPTVYGTLDLSGNDDAVAIMASGNNAYLGRLKSSSSQELFSISIANPASPSVLSSLEINDSVWKLALNSTGSYLYAATGLESKEIMVIAVSNPSSISETSSLNLSGVNDATAIVTFSNYAAFGRDDGTFYLADMSVPATPTVISSALNAGNKINDLAIGVSEAYIFSGSGTVGGEVQAIDINNLTAPVIYSKISLSGNEAVGLVWDFDLNRVFGGGRSNTAEFFVIKP